MTTPPAALTDVYRGRLAAQQSGLMGRITTLWNQVWNDAQPVRSLTQIASASAMLIAAAQAAAANETAAWLRASYAAQADLPLTEVEPFAVPAVVGTTAAGIPLERLTSLASAIWWSRLQGGQPREQAAQASAAWLGRLAASEPLRAVNETIFNGMSEDDRLRGRYYRITQPGACEFCQTIADRGYIIYRPGITFAAHAHCRCTASPEIAVYREGRLTATQRALRRSAWGMPVTQVLPYRLIGMTPSQEAEVRAAFSRATRGVPQQYLRRLQSIAVGETASAGGGAVAYFRPDTNQIVLNPKLFGESFTEQTRDMEFSGWWSKDGTASGMETTLTHEVGHFLHTNLEYQASQEFNAAVRQSTGLTLLHGEFPASIGRVVSQYGKSNIYELVAESWREYMTSPAPRPVAKAIGDALMQAVNR